MRSHPPLEGLRIGCVQYLNAKPLIRTFTGPVHMDHPSQLARDLVAGKLDAALVPVFETLGSRHYLLVDDVAIASDGPVFSVFLAYRGELKAIRRVALDPASLTSIHMLQVLLAEFHGIRPQCIDAREAGETDAQLLIGNQAMDFRRSAGEDVQLLDLGEEWKKQTGLPFVYALWALRADLPNARSVASAFRELKREGVTEIEEIANGETGFDPDLAKRYLTQHIRFDLRSREKAAMRRFQELLVKHGFHASGGAPLEFI